MKKFSLMIAFGGILSFAATAQQTQRANPAIRAEATKPAPAPAPAPARAEPATRTESAPMVQPAPAPRPVATEPMPQMEAAAPPPEQHSATAGHNSAARPYKAKPQMVRKNVKQKAMPAPNADQLQK